MEFFKFKGCGCRKILARGVQFHMDKEAFGQGKIAISAKFEIDDVQNPEPVNIAPENIKKILEDLKNDKEEFKKLILNFGILKDNEKLNMVKKFYRDNLAKMASIQLAEWEKVYSEERKIRVNLLVESDEGIRRVNNLIVWAKKGVKFNPLKTYKKEEILNLQKQNKIVIIRSKGVGQTNISEAEVRESGALNLCVLDLGFKAYATSQSTINRMKKINPVVTELVLNDINLEEIKSDYENIYLPSYKSCLKYLLECAQLGPKVEEKTKENLQKLIKKSDEKVAQYEGVAKEIIDTSKGR